jgi:hypothetical protein
MVCYGTRIILMAVCWMHKFFIVITVVSFCLFHLTVYLMNMRNSSVLGLYLCVYTRAFLRLCVFGYLYIYMYICVCVDCVLYECV